MQRPDLVRLQSVADRLLHLYKARWAIQHRRAQWGGELRSALRIVHPPREQDEEMSQQIQDLMFVFDNLIDVDDRGIQAILREVNQDSLLKAIKGADEELKNKALGPVRLSEVETAQKEILSVARRLADSGEIMLGGGGGEEFL